MDFEYYVIASLASRPERNFEEISREFYSQYGAAAAENGICDVNAGALTLLQRGGERRCPACGAKIDAGDAFCRSCGYRL